MYKKLALALFASAAMAASADVATPAVSEVENIGHVDEVSSDSPVASVESFFAIPKGMKPTKTASEDVVLPNGRTIHVEMEEFSGPEVKQFLQASEVKLSEMLESIFGKIEEADSDSGRIELIEEEDEDAETASEEEEDAETASEEEEDAEIAAEEEASDVETDVREFFSQFEESPATEAPAAN